MAPFYEDNLAVLKDVLGVEHLLFGSDWPHAEGLANPLSFVDDLKGFTEPEVRAIMHDNAAGLSRSPT